MKAIIKQVFDEFVKQSEKDKDFVVDERGVLNINHFTGLMTSFLDNTKGFASLIEPICFFVEQMDWDIDFENLYPHFYILQHSNLDGSEGYTAYVVPIKTDKQPDLLPEDGFRLIFS